MEDFVMTKINVTVNLAGLEIHVTLVRQRFCNTFDVKQEKYNLP